jgi:hypothetical protein
MSEMSKFQRSWLLVRTSIAVVGRNKKLLVFPIVTFVLTAVILLFFLAQVVLQPTGYSLAQAQHWQAVFHSIFAQTPSAAGAERESVVFTRGAMAYLVFLYFVSMFFATFFNVAFYNEILAALAGQPVSLGRGLRFAMTRWRAVLMWTLFAGLVGLIIKAIEERVGLIGKLIVRLIGMAWSVAAVFVIPVIVREERGANPVSFLRQSATVLKRTWGEALIGYAGLTFGNALIAVASLVLLGAALFASIALSSPWIIGIVFVVWLLAVCAWGYLTGVASQVYKGALYLYAADGVVAGPYNREMFDSAWKFKKS